MKNRKSMNIWQIYGETPIARKIIDELAKS